MTKQPERESKEIWIRTGKVVKENSINNKGVVTLEEERSKSSKKTRLVATHYQTNTEKSPIIEIV